MLLIKEDKGQQVILLSGFGTYDMQNLKNAIIARMVLTIALTII